MSKKVKLNIKNMIFRVLVIAGAIYITFTSILPNFSNSARQHIEQTKIERRIEAETHTRANIDIQKQIASSRIENAKLMVNKINSDVEYILATVNGTHTITHDKSPENNWNDMLIDSSIELKTEYQAIYSIPSSKVFATIDKSGIIMIEYDTSDIEVKSVEITSYTPIENRKVFGKKYTHEELIALIELSQDQIRDRLSRSEDLIHNASKTLETHMKRLGTQFGVYAINFNGKYTENIKGYEFVKMNNVTYGTNGKYLDLNDVKYIVVHDTNNVRKEANSLMHYNYLNNNPDAYGTHFYVDSEYVRQMMDLDIQMMGVGNNKWMENQVVNNSNSISIEICVNDIDETEKLNQAILNCASFINELKQQLPNEVEVVTHQQANLKECPKIFIEGTDTYAMKWNDFLDLVNNKN